MLVEIGLCKTHTDLKAFHQDEGYSFIDEIR
ncbi:hypothetical protein BCO_0900028 (plasmid) [Borrelia coriaceae ATCC 43381]|uniref:Uncharacterized protein n=1 Tax=Borrelia coriaceae ATCC 43381 TaxID=1408429 RepID=W5T1K2_9SPIR|nr:hypothetical protein BCO_0900028 [Borrelia coriaceae ATCC 43381]